MNEQKIFGYQQEAPGQPVMPGDPAQPPPGAPFQGESYCLARMLILKPEQPKGSWMEPRAKRIEWFKRRILSVAKGFKAGDAKYNLTALFHADLKVEKQHFRASEGPYKFSPDELRVMAQCNRESFYQRSLPLSTAFGMGTFMALQKGYFKPNPRFGALPKMSLAVLVGYFLGKLSYQQACAEKLMALPGSYIGQLLRERRDGRAGTTMTKQSPTMFGAGPNDIYSDAGPGSSLDLDSNRPVFSEDTYRPDNEGAGAPADPERKGPSLSYEDLRRKNRGDYSEVRQDPYRMDPSALPPIGRPRPAGPAPAPPPPANTNKYGDVMD